MFWTCLFTAALFTTAEKRRNIQCPLMGVVWYLHIDGILCNL